MGVRSRVTQTTHDSLHIKAETWYSEAVTWSEKTTDFKKYPCQSNLKNLTNPPLHLLDQDLNISDSLMSDWFKYILAHSVDYCFHLDRRQCLLLSVWKWPKENKHTEITVYSNTLLPFSANLCSHNCSLSLWNVAICLESRHHINKFSKWNSMPPLD